MDDLDDVPDRDFHGDSGKDDIDDLLRYVDDNPNDHEKRWRLAKKLYMAWEYKRSLEHLLILREAWHRKLNVLRYLAATYYRLGRYDESVKELTTALKTWPDEVGLHEQLARVYEVSGKNTLALAEWKKLLSLEPGHAAAGKAVERLQTQSQGPPSASNPSAMQSDSEIDLLPKITCPHCGAQNSADFDRCWQCHAALAKQGKLTPLVVHADSDTGTPGRNWALGIGLLTVAFLSGDVYLTLREIALAAAANVAHTVPLTVDALLRQELMQMRYILAGSLFAGWIVSFWIGLAVTGAHQVSFRTLAMASLFLTSFAYLITWTPVLILPYLIVLPAVAAFAFAAGGFGIGVSRALGVWAIQLLLSGAITLGVVIATTGGGLLTEYGAIARYASTHDKGANVGIYPGPDKVQTPFELDIQWQSSGSPWLDALASESGLEVTTSIVSDSAMVKLMDGQDSVRTELVKGSPFMTTADIKPDRPYVFVTKSKFPITTGLRVFGVLVPTFGQPRFSGLTEPGVEAPAAGTAR